MTIAYAMNQMTYLGLTNPRGQSSSTPPTRHWHIDQEPRRRLTPTDAYPASPKDPNVRTAQDAITTWLACQREGGLEELVRPHVTEETLTDLRSQTQHREQPWPQSLEELQEILIDANSPR